MADFAPNYTNRYRIAYQAHGQRHEMTFRYSRSVIGPPDADMVNLVQDFFTVVSNKMVADLALLSESYSLFDTNFFLPITTGLLLVGTSTQAPEQGLSPVNVNFQGLTTQGNRGSLYLYGYVVDPVAGSASVATNYRLTGGEDADVAGAVAVLNTAYDFLVGSDNNRIQFYNYANINVNSYYQRKARG